MKKLIKYGVIIILSVIVIDIFVGVIGDRLTENLPDYGDNLIIKPHYALQKAQADVLILGSSRAEHHYDTKILQSRFPNHSIYNAGQHNQGMNYALAVLKSCSERKMPRIVILDCEPETMKEKINNADNTLRIFFNTNKYVRNILNGTLRQKMIYKCNMYKYNSVFIKLFLDSKLPNRQDTLMGYEPLYGNADSTALKYHYNGDSSLIEDAQINFLSIIAFCKSNNIKLYCCISPYYGNQNENDISYTTIKKICSLYHVPLLDYMNDKYFDSHPEMFYNVNHLNDNGAKIFTSLFADEVSGL